MKTQILPVIWFTSWILSFVAAMFVATVIALPIGIAIPIAWFLSCVCSLATGSIAMSIYPSLRFSTAQEIDGLGYVHAPIDYLFYVTGFSIIFEVVALLRG
jgi:hypothetical protein